MSISLPHSFHLHFYLSLKNSRSWALIINTYAPDSDVAFMQSDSSPRKSKGSSPTAVWRAALYGPPWSSTPSPAKYYKKEAKKWGKRNKIKEKRKEGSQRRKDAHEGRKEGNQGRKEEMKKAKKERKKERKEARKRRKEGRKKRSQRRKGKRETAWKEQEEQKD